MSIPTLMRIPIGEGSGTDDIYYNFHLDGYEGDMSVTARMWYQSLPPKWMEELFATSDPVIDEFETMYDNADQQPVLMAEEVTEQHHSWLRTKSKKFQFNCIQTRQPINN